MDRTPRAIPLLTILLIAFLPACVGTRQPEVRQAPDVRTAAAAAEEPREQDPVELDTWLVEQEPPGSDEPAAPPLAPAGDPFHDEHVTASPFDDLAEVDPDAEPCDAEGNREKLAEAAPTFDIPIELNDRVLAWIERYSGDHKRSFEKGLARSGRYIDMFRRIFAEEGVPQDLVYMAHVESGYKTSAYSRAHARGIYQFISSTARLYDLRVDYWMDERADPEKSARSAARYMKKLYGDFGDWYLALAAYNAGEGKIGRAIARTGSRDFWEIAKTRHIRRETKNHIPAVLAATVLSKEPEKYGLTFNPEPPVVYDSIRVDGAADLRVLARCAGTDTATLKALNPAIRRNQTPPDGPTDVRVPVGTGPGALAALHDIPRSEWVLYAHHRVKSGDTLSRIARNYGVSVRAIQDSNGMGRRTLIRVNQVLKVPTSTASRYADSFVEDVNAQATGGVVHYRVRRGDTLYGIARRYGTTAHAIAAASDIAVNKLLGIGESLTVVPGVRSTTTARRIARGTATASGGDSARVHTIRRGDTLWDIAMMYKTTVSVLCSLNEISPSAILRPGNRLTVGYE